MRRNTRNLGTALKRRKRPGNAMADFDRLPRPLRGWLAGAALPWSPKSAQRIWARALHQNAGCETRALAALSAAEANRLAADSRAQCAP
ncbi:MAG: DUF6525 family protein [Sulfitobacter sp.]